MGLHLCPIEPADWASGPNGNGGDEECTKCGGTGVVMVNGVLPIPCNCTATADDEPDMADFF
jgi:hypothetical protein